MFNFQIKSRCRLVMVTGLLVASAVAPAGAGTLLRVSMATDGAQGNRSSFTPDLSRDGRFVVFASSAANLVPDDSNGATDIFVRDQLSGRTERVSVNDDGVAGNGRSGSPAISGDGRYVVFRSAASNLVADDVNRRTDIFLHDRNRNTTRRISIGPDGKGGNANSTAPGISGDGRFVVFQSSASNLVKGDDNDALDIFVYDRQKQVMERVSVSSGGAQANGSSRNASISDDGRYVVFESAASNLVSGDSNGRVDIFVRDREARLTTRVSVTSRGEQVELGGRAPAISGDGRYVVFHSRADDLVEDDRNGVDDVFIHDRVTGKTTRVSVSSDGDEGNRRSRYGVIDASGRYIVFESDAENLVKGDTNLLSDIFVHRLSSGTTFRVSISDQGSQGERGSFFAAISGNGRYIAFHSSAGNLVTDDTNRATDVFLFDRLGSATTCHGEIVTIRGTEQADIIRGTPGDDVIHGFGGNDVIYGFGGRDVICGGDGDDSLFGDEGADRLYGDDGRDTLLGGDGDDVLQGNDGDDYLQGDRGADLLEGLAGNDELLGGDGDDSLRGGEGDDTCRGGLGSDVASRCEVEQSIP